MSRRRCCSLAPVSAKASAGLPGAGWVGGWPARQRDQQATAGEPSSGLSSGGRGGRVVEQLGFELGHPPVGEADVGAGGLESFLQGTVVLGELADALFEGGVLGGDLADDLRCPFAFGIAGLPHEGGYAVALGADLGERGLQCGLGVEGAFPPGRLLRVVVGRGTLPGAGESRR